MSTLLLLIHSGGVMANAQHLSSLHTGDWSHAHWHAPAEAVKVTAALRLGGHVVFFRHGKTDMLAVDQHPH
jgi:hypothetical protein